jgi:hypothetical protein
MRSRQHCGCRSAQTQRDFRFRTGFLLKKKRVLFKIKSLHQGRLKKVKKQDEKSVLDADHTKADSQHYMTTKILLHSQ